MEETILKLNDLIELIEESSIDNKEDFVSIIEDIIENLEKGNKEKSLNLLDDLIFDLEQIDIMYEILDLIYEIKDELED